MSWATKTKTQVGAVLRKKSSRDLSYLKMWLPGWLGIWGRKSYMDQVGGRESGIKDFGLWHSSCALIDLIAWFLGSTLSKSGFYCQLHELSKEGYGGDGPTHVSFLSGVCVVPVFWAAAPFPFTEILLMVWGSDCQLQMCVLPGGATSDSSCNHSYFRRGVKCREPHHKYKTHLRPASLAGWDLKLSTVSLFTLSASHWAQIPAVSPQAEPHTHCSAKLIQLSVCQHAATVPFGPTGVLLISHSWVAC